MGKEGEDGFFNNDTNQKIEKLLFLQFWSALTGKIERRLVLMTLNAMAKTMGKVTEENQDRQGGGGVRTSFLKTASRVVGLCCRLHPHLST